MAAITKRISQLQGNIITLKINLNQAAPTGKVTQKR